MMSAPKPLPPAKPPRRFRLQVSLRMLLILMAAVGVSLAVFRWPWEETKQHQIGTEIFQGDIADYVTKTTYHRNWRGKPELHGPMRIYRNQQLRIECSYYDGELHGPKRVYDMRGRILWEAHFRNGLLHGPFRAGNGEHWYWNGDYWAGEPHGQWEFITYHPSQKALTRVLKPAPPQLNYLRKAYLFFAENEGILARRKGKDEDFRRETQTFHRGLRQGEWKWETLAGQSLQQVKYENDNLVSWNGQPVVEEFWTWLKTSSVPADIRKLLHASQEVAAVQDFESGEPFCFRLVGASDDDPPLVVYALPTNRNLTHLPPKERALVPMLCELACLNDFTFDCRYGTLWFVPKEKSSAQLIDQTGVMQIRFPEGSQQARDWLAEVALKEAHNGYLDEIVSCLAGSSIAWRDRVSKPLSDPQGMEQATDRMITRMYFQSRNHPSRVRVTHRLPRRDALGLLLYRAGFRCEQQSDGQIVIQSIEPSRQNVSPF